MRIIGQIDVKVVDIAKYYVVSFVGYGVRNNIAFADRAPTIYTGEAGSYAGVHFGRVV